MRFKINDDLQCQVGKCNCKGEQPHCHITRNGFKVACVWLFPVAVKPGHLLYNNEVAEVEAFVCKNKYDLRREYERANKHGAGE